MKSPRKNRRFFLKSLAGLSLLASPLSNLAFSAATRRAMPLSKIEDNFLRHSDIPWALETRRSSFGFGPITPDSHFFVRNNLPMPSADIVAQRDNWRIEVGGVEKPSSITLGELKSMERRTIATVLQCSGNGRAFFQHQPSGSQWGVGAAGCALWTGVSVAAVLDKCGGVKDGLAFLTSTGAEEVPEGIDINQVAVERSISIDKALQDCVLVWEMNGAPLPLAHGGPVRLIVPGYFGVNSVKWVKRLTATKDESSAKIQQTGYRLRDIGQEGGPKDPSMYRMPVKSWLNGPGADNMPVLSGKQVFYGVAFSGERGITRVEVSLDEGKHWRKAEFVGPDLGIDAWRVFQYPVELPIGEHRVFCRAQDGAGDWQPRERMENQRGYGQNGWQDLGLTVRAVAELPVTPLASAPAVVAAANKNALASVANKSEKLSPAAQRGRKIFLNQAQPGCGVCHAFAEAGSEGAVGPNLDQLHPSLASVKQAVTQGVGIMPAYAGQLNQQEIDALSAYVFETSR